MNAIDALISEEDRLRAIGHQFKAECENQRASLDVSKETHLLQADGRKS